MSIPIFKSDIYVNKKIHNFILFYIMWHEMSLKIYNVLNTKYARSLTVHLSKCWCWNRNIPRWLGKHFRSRWPGGRLNIRMSSYQYNDLHVTDKTVSRLSYLKHGNPPPPPNTWERCFLYWDMALVSYIVRPLHTLLMQNERVVVCHERKLQFPVPSQCKAVY